MNTTSRPFRSIAIPEPMESSSPQAKRRKVRKGTRSCWECRRRKLKCVFGSLGDTKCASCKRRGICCVNQQFPEQIPDPSPLMGDRIARVEAVVENLVQLVRSDSRPSCGCVTVGENGKHGHDYSSSNTIIAEPRSSCEAYYQADQCRLTDSDSHKRVLHLSPNKHLPLKPLSVHELSQTLFESLPTPHDTRIIANCRGDMSARFYQILTVSYSDLSHEEPQSLDSLFRQPAPDSHPVLIARYMLRIATFLQHLHPDLYRHLDGLSEPPRQMMGRLFDAAVSLVTPNENLIRTAEGLECIIMQSLWHVNGGNLSRGLLAIRKAMTIAQSMGFHRRHSSARHALLSSGVRVSPRTVWFRIVFAERHICLMLSLPQSSVDQSMASEETVDVDTTPMDRLERIHCGIASRILQRNQSAPGPNGFTLTQELDKDLQEAAGDLPISWWVHSHLATALNDPETLFWDMRRLFHQLFHYFLVIQAHLPYMLHQSPYKHQYSTHSCVSAAREVLSRFVTFQSPHRAAFWCRTMDYFAFVAAMMLLMAHVDGHCQAAASRSAKKQQQQQQNMGSENLLTHQRPGDIAMVGQVQSSMKRVSQQNEDALGLKSVELLRRLMVIEADAAGSHANSPSVSAQVSILQRPEEAHHVGSGAVLVYIPYCGTVKISRGGTISKELLAPPWHSAGTLSQSHTVIPDTYCLGELEDMGHRYDSPQVAIHSAQATVEVGQYPSHEAEEMQPRFLADEDVSSMAGFHDWSHQGVDVSFFASLVNEAGDESPFVQMMP